MTRRVHEQRSENGQSLVELALTIPLLIMILAGATHYGLLMRTQQVITNASRVGARRATQPQGDAARVQNAVLAYCEQAGLNPANATVQVSINTATSDATVTVTYQFSSPVGALFIAAVGLVTGQTPAALNQLQATTVMRL